MEVDKARELGYLDFPPVEDAVASYLSPAAPTMRIGKKPVLPSRAGKQQMASNEKAYLAVTLMTAKFEADMKNREALQACIPRSTWPQAARCSYRLEGPRQPP